MTEHPITPPPELVEQWIKDWTKMVHQWALVKDDKDAEKPPGPSEYAATQAARWGADQELEACEKWLSIRTGFMDAHDLHIARRPKPPTLKQQALAKLPEHPEDMAPSQYWELTPSEVTTIRRALEALPDD